MISQLSIPLLYLHHIVSLYSMSIHHLMISPFYTIISIYLLMDQSRICDLVPPESEHRWKHGERPADGWKLLDKAGVEVLEYARIDWGVAFAKGKISLFGNRRYQEAGGFMNPELRLV